MVAPLATSGMTDGTGTGTTRITDFSPGTDPEPQYGPGYVISFGGMLVFEAADQLRGDELWESDGTAAGTALVRDIYPGTGSHIPTS